MKKIAILMMVLMLSALASAAVAGDKGEGMVGRLFLFQKCDPLVNTDLEKYDANGCPKNGPWPIIPDNRRWGQMKYNLLGPEFRFSFQGKNLLPETDYRLIYYPDPWPGNGLVCLGGGASNPEGNIQIHGKMEILSGLPAPNDANFNPVSPSGAVGAKIWLVPAADVQCEGSEVTDEAGETTNIPPYMLGWNNPASYLFEANLIGYQYVAAATDDDADTDEEEPEDVDADDGQPATSGAPAPAAQGSGNSANNGNSSDGGNGGDNGKGKGKDK